MVKNRLYSIPLLLGVSFLLQLPARAQRKVVSELTLVYDYSAGPANKDKPEATENAVHTVYIKGNLSRSEMTSPLFSSTTIFDANTGFAVILKEVSGQKLLIRLNPDNWSERNRMYDSIVFKNAAETRLIAGYHCIKAMSDFFRGYDHGLLYEGSDPGEPAV